MIRTGPYILKEELGRIVKDVSPTTIGIVRMENPLFKNAEVECIADECIGEGSLVKVLDQECDLLKVTSLQHR